MSMSVFFKHIFIIISLLSLSTELVAQKKQKETIYKSEYEDVTRNVYNKKLLSLSEIQPPKHIDYKGPEITTGSTFLFGTISLERAFPTAYPENHYLPYYFSSKAYKCPTALSLLKYYQPIIDKELEKHQLPKELNLVPMVCSVFNPTSKNGIGGEGFWHLTYPQAVKYGLRVDEFVDERRDFEKSTFAALSNIKQLYELYQNWELALAAYSCGVVNVNKAILRSGKKDYKSLYELLPTETNEFVNAFTAMVYIVNYDDYEVVKLKPKFDRDTLTLERKLQAKALEDVIGFDKDQFTFLNPVLNFDKAILPANYPLYFDKADRKKIIEMKDSIYFYQDSILNKPKEIEPKDDLENIPDFDGEPVVYTVKSGDVLGIIAERYKVSVAELQSWNNLRGTRIDIGQKLSIYGERQAAPEPVAEEKQETKQETPKNNSFSSGDYSIYTVKSGDNLWLIAKNYPGISADDIMKFNNIDANLNIGQQLKIPKK